MLHVAPLVYAVDPFFCRSEYVDILVSVVYADLPFGVVFARTQTLLRLAEHVETEAVALALGCLDFYHRSDCCIIGCSRIGYHLDAFDFVAEQALEFVVVVHFSAVYVVNRLAATNHFQVVAFPNDARHFAQCVERRPRLLERRPGYLGYQCAAFHTSVG